MGISSIPILFGNIYLIIAFILSGIIFFLKKKKFDKDIVIYSIVWMLLFFLHVFAFNQFIYAIFIAYFLRIYTAYFIIKIVGRDIDTYIIKQIYFFCITSVIITTLLFLFPSFIDFIYANITPFFDELTIQQPNRQHFVLYTMELGWKIEIPRNSGPFWEPGGFAVFIFLAFTFNLIRTKNFIDFKNIVFLVTILTTQSTAAYLGVFIFSVLYILFSKRLVYSLIFIPVLLIVFIFAYNQLGFLGEKVEGMYEDSKKESKKHIYSRVVSGQINFENFYSSPFFGIGRFYEVEEDENTGNNGTTLLLAEFGLIGFLFYFYCMSKSYRNYCIAKNFNPRIVIAIIVGWLVLGYSQGLFSKPFFIGLSMMFLYDSYAAKRKVPKKLIINRNISTGFLEQGKFS